MSDEIKPSVFLTKSFWRRALTAASPIVLAASQAGLMSAGVSSVVLAGIGSVLGMLLATGNTADPAAAKE